MALLKFVLLKKKGVLVRKVKRTGAVEHLPLGTGPTTQSNTELQNADGAASAIDPVQYLTTKCRWRGLGHRTCTRTRLTPPYYRVLVRVLVEALVVYAQLPINLVIACTSTRTSTL